jgi:hypothetical protein
MWEGASWLGVDMDVALPSPPNIHLSKIIAKVTFGLPRCRRAIPNIESSISRPARFYRLQLASLDGTAFLISSCVKHLR